MQTDGSIYGIENNCYYIEVEAFYYKAWEAFRMKPHVHDATEIMYVLSGSATACVNNDVFTLYAGNLIMIDAQQYHALIMEPGQKCRIMNLEFRPSTSKPLQINEIRDFVPYLN